MDTPDEILSLEEGLAAIKDRHRELAAAEGGRETIWMVTMPEEDSAPEDFFGLYSAQNIVQQFVGITCVLGEDGVADARPVVLPRHQGEQAKEVALRRWAEMCARRDAATDADTGTGDLDAADPDAACVERARARAVEAGLDPSAVDGFAGMDRETLLVQAALWHRMSTAHQNRGLDVELRSGEVISSLFDLCREHGIEVPDAILDAACAVGGSAGR